MMSLNWFKCFVQDRTGENSCGSQRSLPKLSEGRGKTRFSLSLHRVEARLFTALVAALLLTASHITTVQAATFTVSNIPPIDDQVDANIGDGNCATTGGVCTLRAAIQEVNALGGKHTIKVPTGVYQLKINNNINTATGEEVPEDNAATGDLDIKADVTISGDGVGQTIIDGNHIDRVFDIRPLTISTLAGPLRETCPPGQGPAYQVPTGETAATTTGATVTIRGMKIENGLTKYSTGHGGGIKNAGVLTLDSVTVSVNDSGGSGAGAASLDGGGIRNDGFITLQKSVVEKNHSHNSCGGINNVGHMILTDSEVADNKTDGPGGGICNANANSGAQLERCAIIKNTAYDYAGGINNSGRITLINCTITDNNAGINGGAIASNNTIKLIGSTVTDNTGASAIYLSTTTSTACLRSTIIDQSSNMGCNGGSFISEGYNIDRGATCKLTAKFRGILVDQQNVDPLLKRPAAYNPSSASTRTHALQDLRPKGPPSPAIDAAPVYSAYSSAPNVPATDQRGFIRPQFACFSPPCYYTARSVLVDIGAYEFIPDPTKITPPIQTLRPRSINIFAEKLVLLVEGENLLPGATVYWNGAPLATEVRDSSHVEAYVQPEMFPRCGEYSITVGNPGTAPSSSLTFYVDGCDDIRMDETKR